MKDAFLYRSTRPLVTWWFKTFYHPKYEGLENIPLTGRVVLAGNHTHNFDSVFLLSSTKRNIHFLAKVELFRGKSRFIFKHMGLIPVDRSRKAPEALEAAKDYLKSDLVVGIFPEGKVPKTKEIAPFKFGAVKMAYDTKSKIIPFYIEGDYKLFSKNLKIKFLKPFTVTKDLEKSNEKLRNLILKEKGEIYE